MATQNHTITFVYFISAGASPIKIGVANDPEQRRRDLQTAHYKPLHILYTIECNTREQAFELEKAFHRWYEDVRLLNEWFNLTPQKITNDINLLVSFSQVIHVHTFITAAEVAAIEAKAEKKMIVKNTAARALIIEYLNANPNTDKPVRELAAEIGVGKSTVAAVMKEWKEQHP